LRRGPDHNYSDFVPDGGNDGFYVFFDATNLLFRFRLGSVMPGSKGYSILLDTDGKFGASGPNADPNYQAATTGVNGNPGFEIFTVNGWDYEALHETYRKATDVCRKLHRPVLVHVKELTQPQGHSTSGSHERYKTRERLDWEKEFDCIRHMRNWIIQSGIATEEELTEIESAAAGTAKNARNESWKAFMADMKPDFDRLQSGLEAMIQADITFKKSEKNNLTFYANFVVLGELFNHMCENYGYGLKKSAEKQNSELLNKPPFNQKKS
jgi:hypothetical protein